MNRWSVFLALLLVVVAGCSGRPDVVEVDNTAFLERRGVTEPTVLQAAAELDDGDEDQAFDRLVEWFRDPRTRQSQARPEALFVAANALAEDGNTERAFYYLDELLDTYPDGTLFRPAAIRQYQLAVALLARSRPAFSLGTGAGDFEALEMLFRIQQRVPGSDLAESALLLSADHYFARGDYDFAEDAYTVFVESYPRSDEIGRVRLRQAWSNLLQYQGPRYDPTPLLDARAQFFDLKDAGVRQTPEIERALAYIEEQFAQKAESQAGWYRRTGHRDAAARIMAEAEVRYADVLADDTDEEPADGS